MEKLKQTIMEIIEAGISAVKPVNLIVEKVKFDGRFLYLQDNKYDLAPVDDLYVVGFGKASAAMAVEVEKILGDFISDGAVVTNYGSKTICSKIRIYEAGHPIVNQDSLNASKEIIDICKKADKSDFIICLVSGGGSALFEALPVGITLTDLQELNKLLIKSGADINEVNTVRKQVSLVKGGKLLDYILPAKCVSLIISDVPGDDISAIASGPLMHENETALTAINILQKYDIYEKIPPAIKGYLIDRINANNSEEENRTASSTDNFIIANIDAAKEAARIEAEKRGFNTYVIKNCITEEVSEAGKFFAEIINTLQLNNLTIDLPACIIAGGETTVTVKGSGKGGRNQELALSVFANSFGKNKYAFASCGTDGIDRIVEAAGGLVTSDMYELINKNNLEPQKYLHSNDSFGFLNQVNGVIPGNPTGTNVMDLMVCIIT